MSKCFKKCHNFNDDVKKMYIANQKYLDPKIIIMFNVRALRSKIWLYLVAYGCDKYVSVPGGSQFSFWYGCAAEWANNGVTGNVPLLYLTFTPKIMRKVQN